jgi:hypothetical protein
MPARRNEGFGPGETVYGEGSDSWHVSRERNREPLEPVPYRRERPAPDDAYRAWFAAEAEAVGLTLEELLADGNRQLLVGLVHRIRTANLDSAGVRWKPPDYGVIARALGLSWKAARELGHEGEIKIPCRRHAERGYADGCPACERNRPDLAVRYSGPDGLRGQALNNAREIAPDDRGGDEEWHSLVLPD